MPDKKDQGNLEHALWVEGPTDRHFLYNVFNRRGVDNLSRFRVAIGSEDLDGEGGWTRVRDTLPQAVRGNYRAVAAVFDADTNPQARWEAITSPLRPSYDAIPAAPVAGGCVVDGPLGYPRLGLWMMPNNGGPGMLEDFCGSLIPTADALLAHAEGVLDRLPEVRFTPAHRSKALIHSWLSWQVRPGLSLAQAIATGSLRSSQASIDDLLAWLDKVFPP